MDLDYVNLECFMGCCCTGAAVIEYARCKVRLSEEEVASLKVIYKGKKRRDIKAIESKMPELYERIKEKVEDWAMDHMSPEPMEIEIFFSSAFHKLM